MATESYRVRVTKDYLVFCSGHFISYNGNECERLHGHNYRVAAEVDGPLDPQNFYLFDFIALKNIMRGLTDELDHRMLIATKNPVIHLHIAVDSVELRYREKRWVFPMEDCILLPIENTTAELLAKYLAERLRQELSERFRFHPTSIQMEVEESFGQIARYEWKA
jgi:6-pyruvoyltetrahydropterin/6-carboxytetrahydropterin synthase